MLHAGRLGETQQDSFSTSLVTKKLVLWEETCIGWSSAADTGHGRVKGGVVAARGDPHVHSLAVG